MKSLPLLFAFLFFLPSFLSAQWFHEVYQFRSNDEMVVKGVVADQQGGAFICGNFGGTVDFDPGPEVVEQEADSWLNFFVAHYSKSGEILWTYFGEEDDLDLKSAYRITRDAAGYLYVVGYRTSPNRITLLKLSPTGDLVWWKDIIEGTSGEIIGEHLSIGDLEVDEAGNIYAMGGFRMNTTFFPGPDAVAYTPIGQRDAFWFKLNSDGALEWLKVFEGSTEDAKSIVHMAIAPGGDVFVTGGVEDKVDFDLGTEVFEVSSSGKYDIIIGRYSAEGELKWIKSMTSSASGANNTGNDIGIDGQGKVYVSISKAISHIYDPGGINESIPFRAQLLKLDPDGNVLQYFEMETSNRLEVMSDGSFYTSGAFYEEGDLDPNLQGTFTLKSVFAQDYVPFIAKYSATGDLLWARQVINSGNYSYQDFSVDTLGNAFGVGHLKQVVRFRRNGEQLELFTSFSNTLDGFLFTYELDSCQGIGVDYMVQDQNADEGEEPNLINEPFWKSPDIKNTLGPVLLTPRDIVFNSENHIRVTVTNAGCSLDRNARLEAYYAVAPTGLAWPDAWQDNLIMQGGEMVLAGDHLGTIEVPQLFRNDRWEADFLWQDAIDPSLWGSDELSISIYVRLISDQDLMHVPEGTSVLENAIENNNNAWRVFKLIKY